MAKLQRWCQTAEAAYREALLSHPASVQPVEQMLEQARAALPAQQVLAARLYGQWLSGAV